MARNPYRSGRSVNDTFVLDTANPYHKGMVQTIVGYGMVINKPAHQVVIDEESFLKNTRYRNDGLDIFYRFRTPGANQGDADTVFQFEQHSIRRGQGVNFAGISYHKLKFYQLHDNNP
mgnify:CR=1 FL=1